MRYNTPRAGDKPQEETGILVTLRFKESIQPVRGINRKRQDGRKYAYKEYKPPVAVNATKSPQTIKSRGHLRLVVNNG